MDGDGGARRSASCRACDFGPWLNERARATKKRSHGILPYDSAGCGGWCVAGRAGWRRGAGWPARRRLWLSRLCPNERPARTSTAGWRTVPGVFTTQPCLYQNQGIYGRARRVQNSGVEEKRRRELPVPPPYAFGVIQPSGWPRDVGKEETAVGHLNPYPRLGGW